MDKLLFSIIIPVYNVEQYLADCLDSVLNQTYKNYEVICVNDGSTDNSLKVLKEYSEKYDNIIIIDSSNGGTASARNIGIEEAKGKYLWFVDSDDWIENNSLQLLSLCISENENLDVVCFNGKLKNEETGKEKWDNGFADGIITGWEYYNKYALVQRKFHFVCVVLRIYRREFILQNRLYFEKGILHEDNLWIPIVFYYAQSVKIIPDSLYNYRIRVGSKMQTKSPKKIMDTIIVANKLSDFFIPIKNIDKFVLYREIAGEYFSAFMPEIYTLHLISEEELKKEINWKNYKQVSIYPRHKRIYKLLSVNPFFFRVYIFIENKFKKLMK